MRQSGSHKPVRATAPVVLIVLLALVGGACEPAARPPSLTPVPLPSPAAGRTSSPEPGQPTPAAPQTPFVAPWPEGWDGALCLALAEVVVMQELAVDIGRAIDEEALDDARALTAELDEVTATVRDLIAQVPDWEPARALPGQIVALVELAEEMALRYDRYLNQGRSGALSRAEEAGAQMTPLVAEIVTQLSDLAEQGLSCPNVSFQLETPGQG